MNELKFEYITLTNNCIGSMSVSEKTIEEYDNLLKKLTILETDNYNYKLEIEKMKKNMIEKRETVIQRILNTINNPAYNNYFN